MRRFSNRRIRALTLGFAILGPTVAAVASAWLLSGDLNTHDPGIYKEGAYWWLGESSDRTGGISYKWSKDGREWHQGKSLFLTGQNWWGDYNNHTTVTWAPEFARYRNQTLCFYSVSTFGSRKSGLGLAKATSMLKGDWEDEGPLITSDRSSPYNAIDPNFVLDAAGTPWLSFGSWQGGIFLTKLNPSTLKPEGKMINLAKSAGGVEAPTIVRKDGFYYLFVSKGTCCSGAQSTYHIEYGRAKKITGPYLDKRGSRMLDGGGTLLDAGGERWKFPGGQSVIEVGGRWLVARHEKDATNHWHPILFINDLKWPEGWPSY